MKTYPTTTTLYFGPWYRRSPFFDGTHRAGCKAYDIYNKMYLPAEYDDPAVEYQALQDGVTLWDVGVERTVQVSGPDADRLIDMITCRDLTRCAVKQCKYMLVTAPDGGIVNDPVLVHPEENVWWMQLADPTPGSTRWASGARSRPELKLPRRASVSGAGAAIGADAGEDRRQKHLRPQVLLVRPLRDRRHPRWSSAAPDGRRCRGLRSTCWTAGAATRCGTRSWARARNLRSGRSRRTRPAGSRPGSSTADPTSRSRTPRSTSPAWSGWSRSSRRTTSARRRSTDPPEGVDRKLVGIEFESEPLRDHRDMAGVHEGQPGREGHRRRLVARPRAQHRLRMGPDRAGVSGHPPPGRVRARRHGGPTAAIPFVDPRKERPAEPLIRAAG